MGKFNVAFIRHDRFIKSLIFFAKKGVYTLLFLIKGGV